MPSTDQQRTLAASQAEAPDIGPATGPGTDAVVRVRGLRKRYGSVTALDGIDLDIKRGEVLALLGPNGAGKTTAVEILEGFRSRDEGEVRVLGTDPAHAGRAWRARIGIVLQSATEGPELTVGEMVDYYGSCYPARRQTAEALELVGLTAEAKSRVHKLSGGQQRRLDVAIGIVGRPELLFLDEPTTGFDPEARHQFWQLIGRLSVDGTSILLTTHYLNEAEALADRIAVLAGGRIITYGDPATLGGRNTAHARVTWTAPEGPQMRETGSPTALINELAEEFGGEIPGLTVTRPTLEDVYLDLIGEQS